MSYTYSSQSFDDGNDANLFAFSGLQSTNSNAPQVNQIAQDLLTLNNAYSTGNSAPTAAYGASRAAGYGTTSSAAAAAASAAVIGSGNYVSEIENQILRAQQPIQLNEAEEITVNGERGIWANRNEVLNWRGQIPIEQYQINQDSNPEIITKRSNQQLEYIQELAIRYLRPPTPPAPGEIIIRQEANQITGPAPPLIIRQQAARPSTPEPLVLREEPPQPPAQVGRKVITISGKRIPPPPRKVIVERLPQLPSKPQSILIERWLPYSQVKRRVIFQGAQQLDPVLIRPRNVIVQWEAPQVKIRQQVKYLGVIRANPAEYVQRYAAQLKQARDLPQFVLDIKTPDGLVLAADYKYNSLYELEGDVQALRLIDLDREGLGEYRSYLNRYVGSGVGVASASVSSNNALIEQVFRSLNRDLDNRISREEAERAFLQLNSRLGRAYGENEVNAFFAQLDTNQDGFLDYEEFRRAYLRL